MKNAFFSLIVAITLGALPCRAPAAPPSPIPSQTFCNPINLDYGPRDKGGRHGADPVIVLFKDKYYLFDTWDRLGYRVSDDLIHWSLILFDAETLPYAATYKGEITAPAAFTDGEFLFFNNFGSNQLLRTSDASAGHWDHLTMQNQGGDPDLFLDDDGKVYMVTGLDDVAIWEVKPPEFSTVPGSRFQPIPVFKTKDAFVAAHSPYGLYYGHRIYSHQDWDKPGALDTSSLDLSAAAGFPPTFEGNWMTRYKGHYYLQDANPDTSCPWYSDSVWEADSIKGPYKLADYSPASMKVGGFINSAGHSCVFQDRYGNYWRVTTMWIGVSGGFERRIGLFPGGFDAQGRMFTQTELGDYPLVVPQGKYDPNTQSAMAGWFVLSKGKTCTASSSLAKHGPELAADENVRTWWSAKTGDAGEWFQMDLGKPCTVNAVQINFADQDCVNDTPLAEDYMAYTLLASDDGKNWTSVVDKSSNRTAVPHDYVAFERPMTARFFRVENVHAAKRGKFCLRDLRVFGNGGNRAPGQVAAPTVTRGTPAWNVTFQWGQSPAADGYVIRYGVAPDALHLNIQVQGAQMEKLAVSCLNADVKYFYRVDAYNDSGITVGEITKIAQ